MHPKVEEAIQQIDAAVFNGDTFDEDPNRSYLLEYVRRWRRELLRGEVYDEMMEAVLDADISSLPPEVQALRIKGMCDWIGPPEKP